MLACKANRVCDYGWIVDANHLYVMKVITFTSMGDDRLFFGFDQVAIFHVFMLLLSFVPPLLAFALLFKYFLHIIIVLPFMLLICLCAIFCFCVAIVFCFHIVHVVVFCLCILLHIIV
jgi:hypothetical protein